MCVEDVILGLKICADLGTPLSGAVCLGQHPPIQWTGF